MKMRTCIWAGVTATIYELDTAEKIVRHQHDVAHTTMAIAGMAILDISDGFERRSMTPANSYVILPADVDHEITAVMDGTIVLNMIKGDGVATAPAGDVAPSGGVALHDGTLA